MTKSINVKFDGKYIFQITVSGSDDLVKTLTNDVWFNSMIRDGIKDLVVDKVKKTINKKEQ